MDNPWYAVQCKANQDARAEVELARQGYEVFRPKLRIRRGQRLRLDSYFPRYLFIRLGDLVRSFATVRSTRGVLRMVGWGGVIPVVPVAVIEMLRERVDTHDCVGVSPRFRPKQKVRITDGPFHDLDGMFLACSGEERVVVLMNILQREHELEFPAEIVAPA